MPAVLASFVKAIRGWMWALVAFLALAPGLAFAQSTCTAMWGVTTNGTAGLYYFNSQANSWVQYLSDTAANGAAGSVIDGSIYYLTNQNSPRTIKKVNFANSNTTGTSSVATFGNIADPTISYRTSGMAVSANTSTFSVVGATMDLTQSQRVMILYAVSGSLILTNSDGTSGNLAAIGILDPESATAGNTPTVSWQPIILAAGASGTFTYPPLGSSGDIYTAVNGKIYIASNSNPNRFYELSLNYNTTTLTLNTAQVVSQASIEVPGGTPRTASIGGIGINPVDGFAYLTSGTAGTDRLTDPTTSPVLGVNVIAAGGPNPQVGMADTGNCPIQPARPTMSKSFGSPYIAASPGTTTLTITITNPNKLPIFLTQNLTDTFPAGMSIYTAPGTAITCSSTDGAATRPVFTTVTAPVSGATNFVIASGSQIPGGLTSPFGGSCSFSVVVSATASLTTYTNTILAGSLTTTAGSSTVAATDNFKVGTDLSITKQVRVGTSGAFQNTVSVGSLRTIQYELTVVNSASGGTGTSTFTDTLPAAMTPLLTVTAVVNGGGSCTTSTSVLSGQNRVTGTFAGAPPGATCTVSISALITRTAGVFPNTATLTTGPDTGDATPTNNSATATATVSGTTLTVAKTNGVNTVTAGGTTAYTITVANLGPLAAPNALLKDPAVTGLSCTNVVCASGSAGATCPSAASVTIADLQGNGIRLTPTFGVGHSLTFRVTCDVTATGQ